MPRRKSAAPSSRPSPRVLKQLRQFDISCSCKCSLIVLCAVGAEPGCRERRHHGICDCKPRELPTCILDAATPHGCTVWREGKQCSCPRQPIPRCLVTGCDERQCGHKCECPRTPTEMCKHVLAKIQKHAGLTPQQADAKAAKWAERLWVLLPGNEKRDGYADRPLASSGVATRTREEAVNLMIVRRNRLGAALWHPDDERQMGLSPIAAMRRQAAGLRQLFGIGAGQKGGAA